MNRTRSKAAGVETPPIEAMAGDSKGRGAAAAAKSRHSRSLHAQPAGQQADAAQTEPEAFPSDDAGQAQDLLHNEHSIDENVMDNNAEQPQPNKADVAQPQKASSASRMRLPPKAAQPKTSRAGKAAKVAAALAEPAAPAEPAALSNGPSKNPLSTTLASVAQTLAASRQRRALPSSSTAEITAEQIDLENDFASESGDSDFQPCNGSDPDISDVEVIDLSQEDPPDVVEQPSGLLSIRSPEQATAATAVAKDSGTDDDEEEFQKLAGKGKRKQPAKGAAADTGKPVTLPMNLLSLGEQWAIKCGQS